MIKGKRLKQGSAVAVISPSSGLPFHFPDLFELGLRNIRELGLEIVEYPTARMSPKELYLNPRLRAKDINDAFLDDGIDGILCSIGGYESVRILPYLDTEAVLKHPKMIMGFSDATTFLSYLNTLGLVTFYGPSVLAGFAQLKSLPAGFERHLRTFLFEKYDSYAYRPYEIWTNGYQDWSDKAALGECLPFEKNAGWSFLQGKKPAEGELWGGCIEVLENLKSTRFYPDPDFFNGKILFFETSEDKPLPYQVGGMLRNYGVQGLFSRIAGMIFARPKDYSEAETTELKQTIFSILQLEFGAPEIPVAFGADFGHTDPKFILPLGCRIKLDPGTNGMTLLESPFENH